MRAKRCCFWAGAVVAIATVILAAAYFIFGRENKTQIKFLLDKVRTSRSVSKCPDALNAPLFSRFAIDLTDDVRLVPLGNLNPGGGHVYPTRHFYVQSSINDPGERPLFAPADIVITSLSANQNLTQKTSDFSLEYAVCSAVRGYFIHIDALSDKILSAVGGELSNNCDNIERHGDNEYQSCRANTAIEISSGEQIGAVWKTEYHSFDIGLTDDRVKTEALANPSRWSDYSIESAVCLADYYPAELKNEINAYFKDSAGKPVSASPACNRVAQDISATAQGVWFNSEVEIKIHQEDPHLALVHDNFHPKFAAFSIGRGFEKFGFEPQVRQFLPQPEGLVNRDFSAITADGKTYCFDNLVDQMQNQMREKSRILLAMPTSATLKMEMQKGKDCREEAAFASQSVMFER